MTSRFAPVPEPPETHIPFVEREDDLPQAQVEWAAENDTLVRLVRLALRQAYDRTPWETTIILRVRKPDFHLVTTAVAFLSPPQLVNRVNVTVGTFARDKRILMGMGKTFTPATVPWGPPSEPIPAAPAQPRTFDGEHAADQQAYGGGFGGHD